MSAIKWFGGLLAAAALIPQDAAAENLFQGDTGAEAGVEFITQGGYGCMMAPMVRDTKVKFEGKSSLRIDWVKKIPYGNTRHWLGQYIGVNTPDLDNNSDYTVSFYAKAHVDDYPLGVHLFSGNGWTRNSSYYLRTRLSRKWKRYEFTFRPKNAKNAPTFAYSLNLMLPRDPKVPDGPVWFDAFQIEKGKKATAYVSGQPAAVDIKLKSAKPMHILGKNDRITSEVKAVNIKASGKTMLEHIVRDWQGKVIKKESFPLKKELSRKFVLPTSRYGWFLATARVISDNKVVAEREKSYVVVRPPVKLAPGVRAFMGMIPGELYTEKGFAAMRALGTSRIQVSVRKQGYLSRGFIGKDKFDFSGVDFHVDTAKKYQMAVKLGAISPFDWPHSYFPEDEVKEMKKFRAHTMLDLRHRKMYSDFIRTIAERYKGRVETFDVGSEDNGRLGINNYFKNKYPEGVLRDKFGTGWMAAGPAFEALCTLKIDAAKILRETCPDARVACIRPSQGRPGDEWFFVWKEFEKVGKHYNSFSIDTYSMVPYYIHKKYPRNMRSGGGPDGRFITKAHAQSMIDKFGSKGQDIFLSETGVCLHTLDPALCPERQESATYTVRDMIAARCAGITSYDMFVGINEYPFGIGWSFAVNGHSGVHMRGAAFSALAQVLENVVETKWVTPDKATRLAFLKHVDGTGVCAVWSQKGNAMRVPEGLEVRDIMGNKFALPENRMLELSETPYYLAHKKYGVLLKKLASPVIEQTDFCSLAFRRKHIDRGLVKFINHSNMAVLSLDLCIKVDNRKVLSRELDIPAALWHTAGFKIPVDAKEVEVLYRKTDSKGKYTSVKFAMHKYTGIGSGKQAVFEMGSVESKNDILPDEPWTPWSGKKDLSTVLYGAWDEQNLYLKAVVNDDRHHPSKEPRQPWYGDSFQLAVDPKNNGGFYRRVNGRILDTDDIEFSIMLTAEGRKHLQMSAGNKNNAKDIRYDAVRNNKAGTTVYTVTLPWSKLGVKPYKGMPFGLSCVFFDDDTGNGMEYYGFIGQGITGRFKNPMKYKKFYLK